MNKKLSNTLTSCMLLFTLITHAQVNTHIIEHATIHIGNGEVIDDGYIVFQEGKIIHVGKNLNGAYKNAVIIDATGKHAYPGLICLNTLLGLNEIDAVRATRDYQEVGQLNPNVRSLIAYNTDSKLTPTAKFNGIVYIQPVPTGGLISGSSSIVRTHAWNWEDAVVQQDDGIHLNWPELSHWGDKDKQLIRKSELIAELSKFFDEAIAYSKITSPVEINLRFESMKKIWSNQANLYVHVSKAKETLEAIQFLRSYAHLSIVWVGLEQAHLITDELKSFNKPVVLNMSHRLPSSNHEDIDMPYKVAATLLNKGIRVALAHGGSWESRNLMFNAGTCAAYGMSKEQALQLITLNAAIITKTDAKIGSIERNKSASIVITNGDILDMKSSAVERIFIDGNPVSFESDQQLLYQKFIEKYGLK
jgi:imidazolonepropionase-like amidohydrolase